MTGEEYDEMAAAFMKAAGFLAPDEDGYDRPSEGELREDVAYAWRVWRAGMEFANKKAESELARVREMAIRHEDCGYPKKCERDCRVGRYPSCWLRRAFGPFQENVG